METTQKLSIEEVAELTGATIEQLERGKAQCVVLAPRLRQLIDDLGSVLSEVDALEELPWAEVDDWHKEGELNDRIADAVDRLQIRNLAFIVYAMAEEHSGECSFSWDAVREYADRWQVDLPTWAK